MVKSVTVPGKCYAISDSDRPGNPIFNEKIILTGLKDPSMNLWMLPIPNGRMWTTPSSVTVSPYSARMMQDRQLEYANAKIHCNGPK